MFCIQVGRALLSSDEAKQQSQGRLLELVHAFGDCLWGLAPGRPGPNLGFDAKAGQVLPIEPATQVLPGARSCIFTHGCRM